MLWLIKTGFSLINTETSEVHRGEGTFFYVALGTKCYSVPSVLYLSKDLIYKHLRAGEICQSDHHCY